MVAVAATAEELTPAAGRALWDRELLYRSMIRWGAGDVVPVTGRPPVRTATRRLARGLSTVGGRSLGRRGPILQALREYAQRTPVTVDPAVEVVYGHIVFPVAPGRPTVWSTQGVLDARPGLWFPEQSALTHARLVARAAKAQFWTHIGLDGARQRVDLDDSKVEVIPPLVDVGLPPPLPRSGTDLTAIFIGAFGAMKGLPVVLEGWQRIGPGIRLEVITNDPAPTDLPASVTWLGPRPRSEVLARLASSDIHVCPSTTESFGGVVAEAMAAGVAQVVDGASVTTEVAGDGALAVPGRDAAAVAGAIEQLAGDPMLRGSVGAAGRARYDAVYHPDVVGRQMARLFTEV